MNAVEAALENDDVARALALALHEWAQGRAACVAEAVEALSARCNGFTPPKTRTNAAFQTAWLAVLASGDPMAVPWLAAALVKRLPKGEPDPIFIERLIAMRDHPDPRFAAAVLALVHEGRDLVRWCHEAVEQTLSVIGDARTRAGLEALRADGITDWDGVLDALPASSTVSPEEQLRWRAIAGVETGRGDMEALFTAVYAAPDDLDARRVLADALQEAGDPRGAFIQLQLLERAGQATRASTQRADALLKSHHAEWLGDPHPIVYRAWFRSGFVERIELEPGRRAPEKAWERYASDPVLSTVREVLPGKAPERLSTLFLSLPNLSVVTVESNAVATALETSLPPRLASVSCAGWKRGPYAARFRERVLPLLEAMPHLRHVTCGEAVLGDVLSSPVAARLDRLTLLGELEDAEVRDALARLPANVTALEVPFAEEDAALSLWAGLPDTVQRFRVQPNAVLSRAGGTTLTVQIRFAAELDRARYPYGLPVFLPRVRELPGLANVEVQLFSEGIPRTAFAPDRWPAGVGITIQRIFESGLTRPIKG